MQGNILYSLKQGKIFFPTDEDFFFYPPGKTIVYNRFSGMPFITLSSAVCHQFLLTFIVGRN